MSIDNVQDIDPRVQYTASASQTVFPYPFPIFDDADLVVDIDGVVKTITTDYTVSGAGDDNGGSVTLTSGASAGEVVTIYRDIAIGRDTDFQQNGPWRSAAINDDLDKLTLIAQQLESATTRAIRVSQNDTVDFDNLVLPSKDSRANKYPVFDNEGRITVSEGTGSDSGLRGDIATGNTAAVIRVSTVAAMKALTGLSDGAEINTLYHTSATGGGAGRYRYTTAGTPAADGVKVHAQDIGGGRFILLDSAITFNHAGAIGDDVADDSVAINAALALGIVLMGEPGKNKYFIGDELTAAQRTTIIGYGSSFRSSSHIKILTLTSYCEVFGLSISGPNATYTAAGYGIFASGTRNGATVAPTMLTDIKVIGTTINNIGNAGVEFDFVKNSVVITNRITNCGYAGGLFYSCDKVRALDNYVDTLSGETTSGQLNAYGFTFTSLSNTSDFVRDPVSVDCEASGNDIRNIPTWHALDTHGGKRIKFKKNNIYNCRRGVILTNLVTVGAEDCVVSGNNLCNELSGTNSNGSQKQGEAFWDIGASASVRNKRNKIVKNTVYQHGDPVASVGANYIEHNEDGVYEANVYKEPYNYGIVVNNNVRRASIGRNTIIDPKGAGVAGGGPTDYPAGLLFVGTEMNTINVSHNSFLRQNSAVATKVFELGISMANTALKSIKLRSNELDSVVQNYSIPDQTGVTGDVELTFTGTLTGCTTSPTGTLQYSRNGNTVTLRIPTITGTSNTTACTITGAPANIFPVTQQIVYCRVTDNGATQDGMALIGTGGVITLWVGAALNAFTAAGTKGIADTTISYKIKD